MPYFSCLTEPTLLLDLCKRLSKLNLPAIHQYDWKNVKEGIKNFTQPDGMSTVVSTNLNLTLI